MSPRASRLLFWLPRVMGMAIVVFLSLFAFDTFENLHGFAEIALGFAVHLIPAAIALAILLIACRWEVTGALLFAIAAALYATSVLPRHPSWALVIALPLLLIAALFFADWMVRLRPRHYAAH